MMLPPKHDDTQTSTLKDDDRANMNIDDANTTTRLDAIEQRIAVAEAKMQQALAIASLLTPRGQRYEQ